MIEKIEDWFINLTIYGSMVGGLGKRHPKMVLILGLLVFCGVCAAHLSLYNNSKPFFSLAAIGSAIIAITLIVFHDYEGAHELEYVDHKAARPDKDNWLTI